MPNNRNDGRTRHPNNDGGRPVQRTRFNDRSDSTGRASRSGGSQRGENRSVSTSTSPYVAVNDIHRVDVSRLQFTYGVDGQEATFLATREALCEWAVTQYTMGRHLYALVMKGTKKEFKDPDEPAEDANEIKIKKYFRDLDEMRKNKEKYEADTAAFLMFSLKRCHPALRRRLQTMTKPKCLEDIVSAGDLEGLFNAIKGVVFHTIEDGKIFESMMQAQNWIRLIQLGQNTNLENYGRNFLAQCEALELLWGRLSPQRLVGQNTDKQEKAANQFKACLFLCSVDQHKYKPVIDDLHAKYLDNPNNNVYPASVEAMMTLLQQRRDVVGNYRSGSSFAQTTFATPHALENVSADESEDTEESDTVGIFDRQQRAADAFNASSGY